MFGFLHDYFLLMIKNHGSTNTHTQTPPQFTFEDILHLRSDFITLHFLFVHQPVQQILRFYSCYKSASPKLQNIFKLRTSKTLSNYNTRFAYKCVSFITT